MYFFETWSYPVAKASLKFVKIYNSGWPELVISPFHPLNTGILGMVIMPA